MDNTIGFSILILLFIAACDPEGLGQTAGTIVDSFNDEVAPAETSD